MILSLIVILSLATSALTQNQCQNDRLNAVKSGAQPVRGVNLGSWVVLESWMSPGPWDESGCNKGSQGGSYLLEKCLGNRAPDVMGRHWNSWITEDDFAEMSRRGINLARLPVGWWQIYDPQGGASNADLNYYITPTDYIVGGLEHIDKAFDLGQKYGIAILLDLHAAPGSQNGNDHSSPAENPGQINWDKYDNNIGQSVDSMGLYAERYANHPALWGFALLNEPAYSNMDKLQDYYRRAYERVRQYSPDTWIILNPLINGPWESGTESHWTGFMNPDQGFTKVGMDLHYYSCFGGPADQSNPDGAIGYIRWDRLNGMNDYKSKNPKPMLVGEWSSCGHFSTDRAGDFTQAEVDVYGTAGLGWTFWSWKVPGNDMWSMRDAYNNGWFQSFYAC